eukprot:TRINITY_DN4496_c0_g1_i1.p1 TRINITY_DN4496_c0_g1~~TRINITY_DN4496_c0_g1_i1.p1  ORF type:complete len:673 (-),score=242.65 TRINITY_DN4496_c0_g1_i1:108-2126(-)
MARRAAIIVALAVLAVAWGGAAAATCEFTAGEWTTWDEARQCLYSIPNDPAVQALTVDAMAKSAEIYAFLDIANNSPDPNLPVQVDVLAELAAIGQRTYRYDYELHDDLRALYDQLNDAHTQYYAPVCYLSLSATQPIAPISYVDASGEQVVAISPFVNPELVQWYKSRYGIDVMDLLGSQIRDVNGYPAMDYFEGYANNSMGMSKDIGTRFNYAMTIVKPIPKTPSTALGFWQARTKRNPFPRKPWAEYNITYSNGTKADNVVIPWAVMPSTTYTGVQSFLADYKAPKPNCGSVLPRGGAADALRERMAAPSIDRDPQPFALGRAAVPELDAELEAERMRRFGVPGSGAAPDPLFKPLVTSTDLFFYQLNDGKTMVMYLDTMAPSLVETYKALNEGFNAAAENGLTRLIIDLTDNGGGSICFGRSLLAYLQGEDPDKQNWGPQDLPLSPLANNLTATAVRDNVENTIWSPSFYDNQQDEPIANSDRSYLYPGVPHVRGGKLRNYTKLVHINGCGDFGYKIQPKQDFKPEDIIIVTHGFCGSTCALFSNHLALYDNVRTVVVGGLKKREQMQYSSFPGLQVLDDPAIYRQLYQLGQEITVGMPLPGELAPRCLPTTASYRYCIREIYPPTKEYSNKPTEYTFQAATHHVIASKLTALEPQYIWYEVLKYFDS